MKLRNRPEKEIIITKKSRKAKVEDKDGFVEVSNALTQTEFSEFDDEFVEVSNAQTQTEFKIFPNLKLYIKDDLEVEQDDEKDDEQDEEKDDEHDDCEREEQMEKEEYKPSHVFSSKDRVNNYFKSICKTKKLAGDVEVNCNLCRKNDISCNSKMIQYYRKCMCGLKSMCNLMFKINKCNSNGMWVVSEKGCNIHAFQNLNLLNNATKANDRGIFQPLKIIIDKYLQDDKDVTAKRVFIKLIEMTSNNPEYMHLKENMPRLEQVN